MVHFHRQTDPGSALRGGDGIEPGDAVTRLWEQHHIVAREVGFPPGIRVSLHFFNTEEEVGQVVEAVRRMA